MAGKYKQYIPSATGRVDASGNTLNPHPPKLKKKKTSGMYAGAFASPTPAKKPKTSGMYAGAFASPIPAKKPKKARARVAPKTAPSPGSAKWQRFFHGSISITDKRFK